MTNPNTEVIASGSLKGDIVTVTLILGEAQLVLTYPKGAGADATDLVEGAEGFVTKVLGALADQAEAQG